MKHLRHIFVLLMVLALALPLLVACNNTAGTTSDTSSAGNQNDTSVPGDESEVNNDIAPEIVELNREIRILCWDWSALWWSDGIRPTEALGLPSPFPTATLNCPF